MSSASHSPPSDAVLQATFACNQLSATVLADAMAEVAALRKSVASGLAVPTFGAKADKLVSDAMDKFEAEMIKGDSQVAAIYQSKAEDLRSYLVTSLEPVFVQQITILKDAAMEQFKVGTLGEGDASTALRAAEAGFVRAASASVPGKTGWSFKLERASLVGAMQAILIEKETAQAAKLSTAGQLQTALSYLQMQQQQIQALQAQMGGQERKWSLGGAYRPPDTNINLSASHQGGRTNLQVSMVPDEGANLLGPNGFSQGVGPANLGLSGNIHF